MFSCKVELLKGSSRKLCFLRGLLSKSFYIYSNFIQSVQILSLAGDFILLSLYKCESQLLFLHQTKLSDAVVK